MAVTFVLGGTTKTLRNPEIGNADVREKVQARGRTHDGILLVADKDLELRRFVLEFEELSATEKADLEGFFLDTAEGTLNQFNYTDHDTNIWTVQFLNPTLDFVEHWRGTFSVRVELEIVGVGS